MKLLIFIILVVAVVWLITRARSGSPAQPRAAAPSHFRAEIETAVQRDYAPSTPSGDLRKVERRSTKDHVPPDPAGLATEAWSPRTQQLEVAGEWYRSEDLRTLFERHAKVSEAGAEIRHPAVLVPDPTNPFDSKAVAVFVDGLHVGYMERPDAARYHAAIASLPTGQLSLPSRQWLRGTTEDTWARVTLSLPRPEHLACPNPARAMSVLLPPGSTVQVTREEEHMDHLKMLLAAYGSEVVVAASLRADTVQRPRSSVEVVAVDIDGRQVGILSPTQTANFLPLALKGADENREVVCRASLRGNALKADVALHARKAHEFNDEALERLFSP